MVVAALTAVTTVNARAQQNDRRVDLDIHGGVGFPTGDLGDIADAGPSFGAAIDYWITRRIAVRVGADLDMFDGADNLPGGPGGTVVPDFNIIHYNAGLVLAVLDPDATRWSANLNIGAGGTTIDTDDFTGGTTGPGGSPDFNQTYFSLNGGLEIGLDLSPGVSVFVGGQVFVTFTNSEDTRIFAAAFDSGGTVLNPTGFDTAVSIPITVGLRIRT